jgi:hypothetical protein
MECAQMEVHCRRLCGQRFRGLLNCTEADVSRAQLPQHHLNTPGQFLVVFSAAADHFILLMRCDNLRLLFVDSCGLSPAMYEQEMQKLINYACHESQLRLCTLPFQLQRPSSGVCAAFCLHVATHLIERLASTTTPSLAPLCLHMFSEQFFRERQFYSNECTALVMFFF